MKITERKEERMQATYRSLKKLFLRQSYLDAWEDYGRSIRKPSFPHWDYVVLTSSNEAQAEAFGQQITYRMEHGVLPPQTKYLVLPDPEGKRIGSGGATLQVLRFLSQNEGLNGDFHGKRILVIHSGGDSKRVPQYSVCGKLFSPVPRELPDGRSSTLFDEFVIGMSGVPGRIKEGMLVLSGDVLLLFNPLQIDSQFSGAAAISMKASVEVGKDHGVFLNNGANQVKSFLHKQTPGMLEAAGAVNDQGYVDLDTGAVLMDSELTGALYSLVSRDGQICEDLYSRFVNEKARISFYGDFLYPLASDSTLEQYRREKPEGEFCPELSWCRERIWETLRPFGMKLISLSPAEFIHFGTTVELLELLGKDLPDYEYLDWKQHVFTNGEPGQCRGAVHNALVDPEAETMPESYAENCWLKGSTTVGSRSVVSGLTLENCAVPGDVALHGVQLAEDGRWLVRIYGTQDNPKALLEENGSFLGKPMREFLTINHLSPRDLWEDEEHSLWKARIFVACETEKEAVDAAMKIGAMAEGKLAPKELESWKSARRYSLWESFLNADTRQLTGRLEELKNRILAERFMEKLRRGEHYIPALKTFGEKELNENQYRILMEKQRNMNFSDKIRVLYAISRSMKYQNKAFCGMTYDVLEQECFQEIQREIFRAGFSQVCGDYRIAKDSVKVTLPVRVNWGGGWTDTPPYCNEHGGVVLNAAIRVQGRDPIEVEVRRVPEKKVVFASVDFDACGEAVTAAEIQDCHNPYDPFALHKAALIACGVIPFETPADLEEILDVLGGGIYISTRVYGIPKGSGLGTSSILAGACVKALGEFLGQNWSDQEIYRRVLNLEQIMSTGGGWQDQVGGLTPGIKYITSRPGMKQELSVEQVKISEKTRQELQERFALIYTGQRRLARNLLRDVVGNYIGGRQESVQALEEMQRVAVLMKFELERGNLDEFAQLLNQHWEISKQLDAGCSNTCIEQIFAACEDLIDGRFIAGAGGGGFLQVILKKGVSRERLQERMYQVFQDSGVSVWEGELV